MNTRIHLSPPHMSGKEHEYVDDAFESNWIAPLGANVDAFEREFASYLSASYVNATPVACEAVALSSGTAALHLALIALGIGPGDLVLVSAFTFCASVNPILYVGATPVFVDSDASSWNLDPDLLREAVQTLRAEGKRAKALIAVSLYGQPAQMDAIAAVCESFGIALIEDAAEALGAKLLDNDRGCSRPVGSYGKISIFSFNGNKIITTSGGGMLVVNGSTAAECAALAAQVRKLATQARESAPHYEHTQVGYNYRLSNVLAGIGRGQLSVLDARVAARRKNFSRYWQQLSRMPGFAFMPEPSWSLSTRWLTCLTIDPNESGADREQIRLALEAQNIESRPLWKPMQLQPVYREFRVFGGEVSIALFQAGLCLPSGSNLSDSDIDRVCDVVMSVSERVRSGV